MGACCSRDDTVAASPASPPTEIFVDAREDAFELDWETFCVSEASKRFEVEWHATPSGSPDDAGALASVGELEAALWALRRREGAPERSGEDGNSDSEESSTAPHEYADKRAERWLDVYEQAIALNDVELEEHHDGWKPVGKAARRATTRRSASSVDFDAEVIIGANHSRRPSSVDMGSRRASSVDMGSRRASSVDTGSRRASSVDTGTRERLVSAEELDANALRLACKKAASAEWARPTRDRYADVEINVNAEKNELARVIDAGFVQTSRGGTLDHDLAPPPRPGHRRRETRSGRTSASSSVDLGDNVGALAATQPVIGGREMRETFDTDPDLDERLVVYYGRFKGGTVHSVKLSATFDAPPHRLVAVAREWDLMPKWNQYAIETAILLVRGLMHVVVYSAIWLPWPLSARDKIIVIDACFVGQPPSSTMDHLKVPGMDEFESEVPHSCAVLLTRTATKGDDVGTGAPKSAAKRKRIEFVGNCGMRMRSLPPKHGSTVPRTRGDIVVHADVKMRFIPTTVVRFVLKVMAPWVHRMIDKMLKSPTYFGAPDSLFQPRIDANPELYDVLKRRLGEYDFYDAKKGASA